MALDALFLLVIIAAVLGAVFADLTRGRKARAQSEARAAMWAEAVSSETSGLGRILVGAGRRLSDSKTLSEEIYDENDDLSASYKMLQSRLLASGTYNGHVEVYVATQFAGILLAVVSILLALAAGASGILMLFAVLMASIFTWWPYDRIRKGIIARQEGIGTNLPDFAEMLVMPLAVGEPILNAMKMVAEEVPGPVANEVLNIAAAVESRSMDEKQAFAMAAERLGTPEARAFFATLLQGTLSGLAINPVILAQAKALREAEHQRRREANKKLPTSLVVIFGLHLLPLLLAVILVPVVLSLGSAV
jgi:Flp pilus assembly protein TadB